jgi:hypothetical protein
MKNPISYKKVKYFSIVLLLLMKAGTNQEETNDNISVHSKYFSGPGVIFTKYYEYSGADVFGLKRFTPDSNEVEKADSIIYQYTQSRIHMKNENDNIELLYHYNRQYLGFINKQNEKIIIVYFINLSNKYIKWMYSKYDWKNNIIHSTSKEYDKNVFIYLANITQSKIEKDKNEK